MSTLRRLILIRHAETNGNSSARYHGSGDVELSPHGIEEMRRLRGELGAEPIDLVVASPLRRAWKAAWIVGDGRPVRLVDGFREIHFGRWEGMTAEEIEDSDPILYADWKAGVPGFEYPGGEPRGKFRERVERALHDVLAAPARSALVVSHKGVIRTVVELLGAGSLDRDEPRLAGVVLLTRDGAGRWFRGRRSSDPPGLGAAA